MNVVQVKRQRFLLICSGVQVFKNGNTKQLKIVLQHSAYLPPLHLSYVDLKVDSSRGNSVMWCYVWKHCHYILYCTPTYFYQCTLSPFHSSLYFYSEGGGELPGFIQTMKKEAGVRNAKMGGRVGAISKLDSSFPSPLLCVCCNFQMISPLKRPIHCFKWLVVFIEVAALDKQTQNSNCTFMKCGKMKLVTSANICVCV